MRRMLVLPFLALTACAPTVPDSGAGVGFGDYQRYLAERERGGSAAPIAVVPATGAPPVVGPAVLPVPAAGQEIAAAPLSDEQDFVAVSARETIESDRERLDRLRAEYEVVQPDAVLERPADVGPSIVEFALATNHPRGTEVYRRFLVRLSNADRNCAAYRSQDEAQEAFLAAGGPERDRLNLDPDGDGYACLWDPAPIRAAVRGGG